MRASIAPDGSITHHLEPEYHLDPLRPEGVLAFTNFGLESLVTLARIGFQVAMYSLQAREVGILGRHALIFELTKPHETRLDAQRPGGKDFATTA